jgi:methionyl-tRNA formyltransferase
VAQPKRLRKDEAAQAWLADLQPDVLVTIAFGQILPMSVITLARLGVVNVHASLLPAYRGPNPIQWALLNGDAETGLTTMLTEEGVDTGAMLLTQRLPITPEHTLASLSMELAAMAGPLLADTLLRLDQGSLTPTPQAHELATHAPKLPPTANEVDWHQPAEVILRQQQAFAPKPALVSMCMGERYKLTQLLLPTPQRLAEYEQTINNATPGQIVGILKEGLLVATASTPLVLATLQPAGKTPIPANSWMRNLMAKANVLPASDASQPYPCFMPCQALMV